MATLTNTIMGKDAGVPDVSQTASIGGYRGVNITPGSQDQVAAQIAAIDKMNQPPVPSTQDAAAINKQISGASSSIQFPTSPVDQTSNNAATLGAIQPADLTSLLSTAPTALDTQQSGLQSSIQGILGRIKKLGGAADSSGKVDTSGALPGALDSAAKRLGYKDNAEMTNQLTDVNNQINALKNEANIIPLQDQQDVKGHGVTAAGLAPIEAGKIRENAIQALKLNSIAQTLQGNIAAAQKMADTAINAEFKPYELQFKYDEQLYNMNKNALQRQDSKQATALQAQLQERARQLQLQQENAKVGMAMANSIMAANKGNQGAQLAAQQALKLDPLDPQYLQKLSQTLGEYQTFDDRLKIAQIAKANADAANTSLGVSAGGQALAPYLKTSYGGIQYADLSSLTPSDKVKYARLAEANGVQPILDTGSAGKLNAMSVAKENLQNIQQSFNAIPVEKQGFPAAQGISNSIKSFFGDADIKSFSAYRTAIINNIQALAGGQGSGLRINQAEIDTALKNDLPIVVGVNADSPQAAKAKLDKLNSQLDVWEKQLLGGGNQASQQEPTDRSKGAVWTRSDGKYVSDGTQWVKQ